MPTEHQKLIHDTLYYRPPSNGTSFVVNDPGIRLVSADASFLPAIKSAILEIAPKNEWRELYGLNYLIGAFLVLGTKFAPDTLVPFIRTLPQAFIKEVITQIPVFFHKIKISGRYNFEVAPAPELVVLAREFARSGDQALQKVAQRAVEMIKIDADDDLD